MKYNRSEIMRNAWNIRRESGCTMSAALKKAWAVAKEAKMEELKIAEMTGSEKQIAWAHNIISIPYQRMMNDADIFADGVHDDMAAICVKAAQIYRDTYTKGITVNPNLVKAAWVIDNRHMFGGAMDQALFMALKDTNHKRYEFRRSYHYDA